VPVHGAKETLMRKRLGLAALALVYAFGAESAQAQVLHSEKSLYRDIFVYEEQSERCMRFRRADSGSRQSCVNLSAPDEFVLAYAKMMMGALYLRPDAKRVLIIGLGGGTIPMAVHHVLPEAQIDAVEIDPAVVRVARAFFNYKEDDKLKTFEQDGRVFVRRANSQGAKYDIIMLDAFSDEYIPEHMLTREFLVEVKNLLAPGGVLAANTFSASGLYDNESATYAEVFGDFYNMHSRNRVIMAQPDGLTPIDTISANGARFDEAYKRYGIDREWLVQLMSPEKDWKGDARILTDQFSPSNLLNVR